MSDAVDKLKIALAQWRDSLVSLNGRNRLLNYRPTRASTIEFKEQSCGDVFSLINQSGGAYTVGTRATPAKKPTEGAEMSLEDEVLELVEFDYSEFDKHLFADKTQSEVDRILKRLAGDARREFLDKGISVLYAAFGFLEWIDDTGDVRKSPLVLVPVSLSSEGPKQPLRLSFSEDDTSINPALALKLVEFGIALPSFDEVEETLSTRGVDEAVEIFRGINLPEGWSIVNESVLANFMFAKEAMYRDLLENEEVILENMILQSLAGIEPEEGREQYFNEVSDEEIDSAAPPELTPLVLDADSSQRSAIAAAMQGRSFVLDGPPGTGKSQTIANIIGALIEDGKKVLFVSEKAVALDVVRDRLLARGLDPFVLELHSHKAVRSEVAARLGIALDFAPVIRAGMDPVAVSDARELRVSLSDYAEAANEIRQPMGRSVHQVLGQLEEVEVSVAGPKPTLSTESLDAALMGSLGRNAASLASRWDVILAGHNHLWSGLIETSDLDYNLETSKRALAELQLSFDDIGPIAGALGLISIADIPVVDDLLVAWDRIEDARGIGWLTTQPQAQLERYMADLTALVDHLEATAANAAISAGVNWRELDPHISIPASSAGLSTWWVDLSQATLESLQQRIRALESLRGVVDEIRTSGDAIADAMGMTIASKSREMDRLVEVSESVLGETAALPGWFKEDRAKMLSSYIRALQEAWAKEEAARDDALNAFHESVIDANLASLSARFSEKTSLFGKLSAQYKADKEDLLRHSKGDLKASIAALERATHWTDCRSRRETLEREHSNELGTHYEGASTNWTGLGNAMAAAQQVAESGLIADLGVFTRLADDVDQSALVRKATSECHSLLDRWKSADLDGLTLPSAVALGTLDDAGAWLDQITLELGNFRSVYTENASLPAEFTLKEVIRAAEDRELADAAQRKLSIEGPRLAGELGMAESDSVTRSDLQNLAITVQQIADLRQQLVNAGATVEPTGLISQVQLAAFHASSRPPRLINSHSEWLRARSLLLSAFGQDRQQDLIEETAQFRAADSLLDAMSADREGRTAWLESSAALASLVDMGFGEVVEHGRRTGLGASEIQKLLVRSALSFWLDHYFSNDARLTPPIGTSQDDRVARFRELDRALVDGATASITKAAVARRPSVNYGQANVIRREAEKKKRHIPVRQLMDRARDVIQAVQPCFMMSPLAVSQYLPSDMKFDVVIFDEASQVTPGDAINCIYRGTALIAAGDQRQLPPTNFFMTSQIEDDESEEEDLANDFESVLDLMKSTGNFNTMTLRWHYRSRHEHLIAYSNASFYDGRLITFPSAVDQSDDMGLKFFSVAGVYRRSAGQDNPIEAVAVAQRVLHHFETRPDKSLGVVAFSAAQRDTIENALTIARAERPELDKYFDDDRLDGFFIKSLEYVQGDERDVMIFSIGYGPDEVGKIYKNFGALNRQGGERRLNVAITRARELVEVVTSMSASQLGEVSSEGARHLRRYLDFAERGPAALSLELGDKGLGTDSPFEDSVIDAIRSWGYDVQPQVGVAGYRIDIGVKHPNSPGAFMLGVECDGAMYHSSRSARDRDRLRHELLEGLGWRIHHIWGTGWYRSRDKERAKLKALLEELAAQPITGRTAGAPRRPVDVELEYVAPAQAQPDWAVPYEAFGPEWLDQNDLMSVSRLADFVSQVVAFESPVHIETLSGRLRDSAGIGRIGNRIADTLSRAIKRSKVEFDGSFLRSAVTQPRVRTATPRVQRNIDQIADEELTWAIAASVAEATGASRADVIARVCSVLGWVRKSAAMTARLDGLIDAQVESGAIKETSAGLRVPS